MASGSLDMIDKDLKTVNEIIGKALCIKPGSIKEFAHLEEGYLTNNFYPAIILFTGRVLKVSGSRLVSLAAIIQFIYLAAKVHYRISDTDSDSEGTDPKDGAQYPVLVGDYLYGRFFTTLCKEGMTQYLKPLAEIICEMNVGGILRIQGFDNEEEQRVVTEKEAAFLLSNGCMIVGRLAEVPREILDNIKEFGYNVGMGYGLLERNVCLDEARRYLGKGIGLLESKFPKSEARDLLAEFIRSIEKGEHKVTLMQYGREAEKGEYMAKDKDGVVPDNYKNKEEYVHDIFSKIAGRYDFLNTVLSLNRDKYWRKFTVEKAGVRAGDKVLDVCCGTGMISTELAKAVGPQGEVIGVDFCGDMIEVGKERIKNTPYRDNIELIQGNAMELPFEDNTFDCATVGFGLRNVPDMRVALKEMMRVVKPGGRVVSLEFAKPTVPGFKQVYNFYFENWVPFLGKLGVGIDGPYTYLHKSWKVFPHQKEVRDIFEAIGLAGAEYYELTGGVVAVHVGTKPHEVNQKEHVAATRENNKK